MLNNHTYYSLKYGTLSEVELLRYCVENGFETAVLTDINNTSACLNFVRLAPQYRVKPVIGVDFRNGRQQLFVALAMNNEGFREINAYLSKYLHSGDRIPEAAPAFENVFVVYPFNSVFNQPGLLLRDNEFIGVRIKDLIRLQLSPWFKKSSKLLMLHSATFIFKKQFNAHRLLRAIDKNMLLSKLPKTEEADPEDFFMPYNELIRAYSGFPQLINNTKQVLDNCHISFEFGNAIPHKNQRTYTGNRNDDARLLRQLAYEGLNYRYQEVTDVISARLENELELITQKDFVSYFLINHDITQYAQHKGYFYVGRGSGANSIVAYLLRITDVDPIELDLYFERFINLYRQNPPDFDIDFSWRDRPDVTRYIFETFPNTALLATYNTFQDKALKRELGKVFGLPKEEIDRLSSGSFFKPDKQTELVLKYSELIAGFPGHLSVHAGGILIAEESIYNYSASNLPPKGYPTVQFDMVIAEDVGLYKFDILGQRGLGKIKDALRIVKENQPEKGDIDIHDLKKFKEDELIKSMLRKGDALGCFYVESPAMRMLMYKMRVDDYLGLVAASSIIRPGVARSGMMREYISRFRNEESRKRAHPVMLEIMPDTFGVMVYQEDVLKVAHYFAGLNLAEADVLRRGMSGKFRSREEFDKIRSKFFQNCDEKGHEPSVSKEIWRQIESFAGYSFAKGHSASYAVESFQSLYLKAHFPLEYMVSTINNFGGFYQTEFYVHEAQMHGGNILPPCVNHSDYETAIYGKDIYLGYQHINGFESKIAAGINREMQKRPFTDLDDFLDRVHIGIEQLELLIRIDAFRFTGKNKREILWEAHFKFNPDDGYSEQQKLFTPARRNYVLPKLNSTELENAFDQLELLGFALCSPFDLLQTAPHSNLLAADLQKLLGKVIAVYGYLVTFKYTKTIKGEIMVFGNFLDREGYFIDTVHFPDVAKKYPFRGRGIYKLYGKVVEEFDCYSLEVLQMEKVAMLPDPRYAETETKKLTA